ncbi:MAG TPA: DUF4383 domain-containing protein [Chloroflexota bacterium]|nr:DUF4383 domain-containing protein [Chloroflexota bacterium]
MQRDLTRPFAAVFGAVFLLVGLAGFAVTGFGGFADISGKTLVFFGLNPLHNLAHIVIGGLWLASSVRAESARAATQVIGFVYLLLGILGLFALGSFNVLALNVGDNVLHLATGALALLVAYAASRQQADEPDIVAAS